VKFELGLFERPYVEPDDAARWNGSAGHLALAREAARASIVLLKNERQALPLARTIRALAVIGPDAMDARLGGYSGAGIEKIVAPSNEEDLARAFDRVLNENGPFFVLVKVDSNPAAGTMSRDMIRYKIRFMSALSALSVVR